MVVEVDMPLSKAMALKLGHSGFDVKCAHDGEEALNLLMIEPFDLVTLDLLIPKLDGFKVLEEIHRRGINTKVIVTSNLSQEEDIIRTKQMGAVDFFVKSNTPIFDIIDHVKRVLGIPKQ